MNDPFVSDTILKWLFENGGPATRYRVLREFGAPVTGTDPDSVRRDLLDDNGTRRWLDNLHSFEYMDEQRRLGKGLGQGGSSSFLHGSKNMNLEVVMPKLAQLGLHAGIPDLDERTLSWRTYLTDHLKNSYDDAYADDAEFHHKVYAYHDHRLIIAFSLARAGYTDDAAVLEVIRSRLEIITETILQGIADIYENPDEITVRPDIWKTHIVKRILYPDGNIRLPFIHDIWNFAAVYDESDEKTKRAIDAIIDWILSSGYHKPAAYAYIRYPSGRGKHVGDNLYLPDHEAMMRQGFDARCVVQRCWQLAHFPMAMQHDWFTMSMDYLESFATRDGRYLFPAHYLTEMSDGGKWVYGLHMGLGENRQNRKWREIESTFWMNLIRARIHETERHSQS